MTGNTARIIPGLFIWICIYLSSVSSQIFDASSASMIIINKFGATIPESGLQSSEYIRLYANVDYPNGSLKDFSKGEVLFIQEKGTIGSWFPQSRGDLIALADTEGYIHLFCGSNLQSALDVRSDIKFDISIFDRGRKAWVNPAFFIKGILDAAKPQITALALAKDGVVYDFKDLVKIKRPLSQGTYSVLTSIQDEKSKQTSSGLIRVKIIVDGVSAIDNKLDIALAQTEGLSFLGYPAPSARAIGQHSRLKVGEIRLFRGDHTIELFAYDFAGNESAVSWKLRIE